jgi:hypothetical protein
VAQYALLIYVGDSAHAHDATPADLEEYDDHADELTERGSMVMTYALTPRDMATPIRGTPSATARSSSPRVVVSTWRSAVASSPARARRASPRRPRTQPCAPSSVPMPQRPLKPFKASWPTVDVR